LLDFGSTPARALGRFKVYLFPAIVIPIILLCLVQSVETARPGWAYRQALVSVAKDIKKKCPPMLVVEGWVGDILEHGYLMPQCNLHLGIKILPLLVAAQHQLLVGEDQE